MILIASPELVRLIGERKVKERTDVSRTGIAAGRQEGRAASDVSTPDALKRTLLAAKSIGQTSIKGGGITALHVHVFSPCLASGRVAPSLQPAAGGPNGRVSVLVASGEAESGCSRCPS